MKEALTTLILVVCGAVLQTAASSMPMPCRGRAAYRIRCPAFGRMFPQNRCERAASGISAGTKIFFQKRLSHTKATPFYVQNHFWAGFWERGP
jgi:hypothetical protein